MGVRAYTARHYRLNLLARIVVCVGLGAWFLYDGYVKYPEERRVREVFEDYKAAHDGGTEGWPDYAREHGLPDGTYGPPGTPHTDFQITTQRVLGFLFMVPGLYFAGVLLAQLRRWVGADETGLETSWGQRAPFERIVGLHKDRWLTKRLAVVRYHDEVGATRSLVLDAWVYDTDAVKAMVREVEARLAPEQVTGNPHGATAAALDAAEALEGEPAGRG